jgi:hypothetical protein
LFATIGMQVMWDTSRPALPSDFVQFIDNVIAKTQLTLPGDELAVWRAAVAAKKAKLTA